MICVVTARMTSKRLPGKPLRHLEGRELLGRVLGRVREARSVSGVIVATSTLGSDDPLGEFCESQAVDCFRGPLDDVAGRLLAAATEQNAEAFVRISGDSPLIDPHLIDRAVSDFIEKNPDLVTNVFPRTFPAGQSVEVINTKALSRLWEHQGGIEDAPELNEHVTAGFYRFPELWNIVNFTSGLPGPHPSMAVDTPEDLVRIQELLRRASGGPTGWRDLLELQANP